MKQRALLEIEFEFAERPKYRHGIPHIRKSEPIFVAVIEPEPAAAIESEAEPVPLEISDDVKNLILRKMETVEELLEEAFFVKKINKKMAEKQQNEEIRIETISPVYPGKITISGKTESLAESVRRVRQRLRRWWRQDLGLFLPAEYRKVEIEIA